MFRSDVQCFLRSMRLMQRWFFGAGNVKVLPLMPTILLIAPLSEFRLPAKSTDIADLIPRQTLIVH